MISSSQILKSAGIYQINFPSLYLGSKVTQAAIDFYNEQARAKLIFDTSQRENDEFWEAIENLTSYPDWYTGDLDLPASVWKNKCKENSQFFELDCIHGTNCKRVNSCECSPDTNKHQLNKHKKKEVARY